MAKNKCDILSGTRKRVAEQGTIPNKYVVITDDGKCHACAVGHLLLEAGFEPEKVALLNIASGGTGPISAWGFMEGRPHSSVTEPVMQMRQAIKDMGFTESELSSLQGGNDNHGSEEVIKRIEYYMNKEGCEVHGGEPVLEQGNTSGEANH